MERVSAVVVYAHHSHSQQSQGWQFSSRYTQKHVPHMYINGTTVISAWQEGPYCCEHFHGTAQKSVFTEIRYLGQRQTHFCCRLTERRRSSASAAH